MINPFVSIDKQLLKIGWKKYYENEHGFRYVKKVGIDVFFYADKTRSGIVFYDDIDYMKSIAIKEADLVLFAAKIKEWRKKYGDHTKNRSNVS